MSAPQDPNFQAPPPPPPTPEAEPQARRANELKPFAIGVIALGLIFIGGAFSRLLVGGYSTGGYSTGGALWFFGIVLFVLSFIRKPALPETERPLSWFEKVTGIFYEPTRVFRNLRNYPYWLGAFLTIWVLTTIYSTAFIQRITPERITDYTVEKIAQMGPPFAPPPEAMERIRADQLESLKNPVQRVGAVLKSMVAIFVFGAIAAALALLGLLVLGGRINFWQSLAVMFYAALPVVAVQKILGLIILFLKSPDDLHPILNQETTLQDNLGILISPADHPVLFMMATFIGLTSFYGLWLRARGLHAGATRVSKGQAWGVAITLWLLLLILVVIFTALFPGFIS